MADMSEVFTAVETIRGESNDNIVVLQCTTNYPFKIEYANLLAMLSMKQACRVRIGYSNHVHNNYACFAAAALGAEIIEKHFTLDKNMIGLDHSSSLNPEEFKELSEDIRNIEKALGNGLKKPAEIENRYGMKRSMILNSDLSADTILTTKHIGFKRPFNGLPPNMLEKVLGKKITKNMLKDEALLYNCLEW